MKLIILSMFLMSIGCATTTPYQKSGVSGGYKDMKLSKDTYQVSFRGNGYTSSDTVQSYFMRRCAELTASNDYDFFIFLNQDKETNKKATAFIPSGNMLYAVPISKYKRNGSIKMFKEGTQPDSAMNAKIILQSFAKD